MMFGLGRGCGCEWRERIGACSGGTCGFTAWSVQGRFLDSRGRLSACVGKYCTARGGECTRENPSTEFSVVPFL